MKLPCYGIVSEGAETVVIADKHNECAANGIHTPTVTNTAELVVEEMVPVLKGRRLFCVDTDGRIDELLVKDGKFAGFKLLDQ